MPTTHWAKVTVHLPHLRLFPEVHRLTYHQHLNAQHPTTWEDLTLGITKVVEVAIENHRKALGDHSTVLGDLTVSFLSNVFPGHSISRDDWPHVFRLLLAHPAPYLVVWLTHDSIWLPYEEAVKHEHGALFHGKTLVVDHGPLPHGNPQVVAQPPPPTEHKLLYPLDGGLTIPLSSEAHVNLAIILKSGTSMYLSEQRLDIPPSMSYKAFIHLIHAHTRQLGLGHAVLEKLSVLDIIESHGGGGSLWDVLKVHGHTVVAHYTVNPDHHTRETLRIGHHEVVGCCCVCEAVPQVLEFPPLTPQCPRWIPCCFRSKL
jgi:hypothetical protein